MVLIFVACSTSWFEPVVAGVYEQLLHLRLGPQQGLGLGIDIEECMSHWMELKWCMITMKGRTDVSPACCQIFKCMVRKCFGDDGFEFNYDCNHYCGSGKSTCTCTY